MKNNVRSAAVTLIALSMVFILGVNSVFAANNAVIPPETSGKFSRELFVAHNMHNSVEKVKAFAEIARQYGALDEQEISDGIFKQTFTLVEKLQTNKKRSDALRTIAVEYRKLGNIDSAKNALASSLFEAHRMRIRSEKEKVFTAIAEEYKLMGMNDEAMSILNQGKLYGRK